MSSNSGYLRLAGEAFCRDSYYVDLPIRLFLRKDIAWQHEQEWRMIKRLDEAIMRIPEDSSVYLFKLPPETVKVIILGAQISPQNKEQIHRLLSATDQWSHVQLLQAHLTTKGFGLEFDSIKINRELTPNTPKEP